MRKILTAVLIGLSIATCNSHSSHNITEKGFTEKYIDSLRMKYPAPQFSIADDSTINAKFKEEDIRISVDNAYREYQAEPDSLQEILSRYLSASSKFFTPKEKIRS